MSTPLVRAAVLMVTVVVCGAMGVAEAQPVDRPEGGAVAIVDPAQYVNPFVGTKAGGPDFGHGGGAGNTFPGADAPFGMVQWSPDTVTYQHGGYFHDDNRIRGFSLTHLSGAGCADFGNVPFMPVLGASPVGSYTFSHANESAAPGAYAVTFDNGLRAELAATPRSGAARFTYPPGTQASLTVDAARAFNAASGSITIGTNTLSGYSDSGGFCGTGNRYRVHFHATFDRPFSVAGIVGADGKVDTTLRTAEGTTQGTAPQVQKRSVAPQTHPEATVQAGAQAFVSFDTTTNTAVTARVGVSFVNIGNAQANVLAEQGGAGFDAVRTAARASWNGVLGRVDTSGGTVDQRRTLYTALYHSLLHPNVFSDVNGQYTGFDGQVRTLPAGRTQYANFSGWDVYRSQFQLVALLLPDVAANIAQSALNQGTQGGYFDRWTVANGGTGVMVGDPLAAMISTAYAFGGTNFDAASAVQRLVAGSHDVRERPGFLQVDTYGFVPTGLGDVWGSASTMLEYVSADFAIGQLAGRIGDASTAELYLRRAQYWRNVFESGSRYVQPRRADRTFPPFTPTQQNEYVEGNAAQYTWMVPHNHRGLFDAMGGNAAVLPRLDAFFAELNAGPNVARAYLGNEPSHNTPWMYAYAGAPYKTQDVVRRALTTLFRATPDGLAGNDDLGQLSSWAVWAAIGLYPQVPGRAELVLASPLFPTVTINRSTGRTLTMTAPNASVANKYVRGLTVNGQPSTRPWLPESLVANGGTVGFVLDAAADPAWGAAAADAPPSFDVGPAVPRTGRVTGLASKCLDVRGGATADGTIVQLQTCAGTGGQTWTLASDGTLRALGKCLDIASSGIANGTRVQLWQCNGTGAQQWWPRPNGGLLNPPSGKCLDVPNSNPADGTALQIFSCNGTAAQAWQLPA